MVDNSQVFGVSKNGSVLGAFSRRWRSSHSSFTFSEALCSSIFIAQAPVSTVPPPSLSAVKGPKRLMSSVLYRKMMEPTLIFAVGAVFLSAQVYCFCLRHCSCVALLQNRTNPEYIIYDLVVRINKPATHEQCLRQKQYTCAD